MNLAELIDELESLREGFGDFAEVRLACQPRWAFEYGIEKVVEADGVVYLTEANQIGYLPQKAAVAAGWSEQEDNEDDEE